MSRFQRFPGQDCGVQPTRSVDTPVYFVRTVGIVDAWCSTVSSTILQTPQQDKTSCVFNSSGANTEQNPKATSSKTKASWRRWWFSCVGAALSAEKAEVKTLACGASMQFVSTSIEEHIIATTIVSRKALVSTLQCQCPEAAEINHLKTQLRLATERSAWTTSAHEFGRQRFMLRNFP